MKLHDYSQNIAVRIGTVQVIGFIFLTILGVRLYHLQINKGDYYQKRAQNQRIRVIPIPAPRGAIFDRNGKLLVDSRSSYNITLNHEPIRNIDAFNRIDDYAEGLSVTAEFVKERLKLVKSRPEYETIVLKENATLLDITWVETHSLEYPELRVELQPQRYYSQGETLAHVLGYVGEISPKQLESSKYRKKGFRPGDIIGKGGVEQYYDQNLRGRHGYRKVIVDSRGRVKSEIESVPPQAGQDLYLTIDLELQKAAEQQLANSATKRGAIIATNPQNGEILAMASAPSFDPNVFVRGSSTRKGRKQITAYWQNEERPLYNRAIQGRYPPGSTWKIPESVAALRQRKVTVASSNLVCGGGITIGSKHTRCMGNHGKPDLKYAITKSCDGYYYRLGLKMGIEGMIKMVETFEYDKPTGIDLPNEKTSRTPKYYRKVVEKRYGGRWIDIETVFASIGQVTVNVTPISMIRAISSVGVGGKLYVPHLLKEFKKVGAVGGKEARSGFLYEHPELKIIEMTPEQNKLVLDGMHDVVNAGGTASRISMGNEFPIAGKTGTAQVTELGKDKGKFKDHAWFVGFAPAYDPKISVIAIIENSGFGGTHAAPAVKNVFEAYLKLGQPEEEHVENLRENILATK